LRQKRRITEENVGKVLIAKRGRNRTERQIAGEAPKDPDRQFREWCDKFKLNPEDLLQRAIAVCASVE
jgi:hypothetical protein